MEKVTKVFFDPLLQEKHQICALLLTLPVGSAHAFRGELLVHSAEDDITSIDISMHNEDYFSNAVSLGDLGEEILDRMKLFPDEIGGFNDEYSIQQAPSSSFTVPIASGKIHFFAVSVKKPTYYDLCVGDSAFQTCCFRSRNIFRGISHSGDRVAADVLLHYITLDSALDDEPRAVFVSGYRSHALYRYKKHNPLVLVADHSTKTLYIVPVPLDRATIGEEATLCCPLVIRKNVRDNTLLCSILPNPAIDTNLSCDGRQLESSAFATAISRAASLLTPRLLEHQPESTSGSSPENISTHRSKIAPEQSQTNIIQADSPPHKQNLLIATHSARLHCSVTSSEVSGTQSQRTCGIWQSSIRPNDAGASGAADESLPQILRFGRGIEWMVGDQTSRAEQRPPSNNVLPCILGDVLEGPLLLAIGETPTNVPFSSKAELHQYYELAKSIVVVVDENMTDNARSLAKTWRLNGLFILQASNTETPDEAADVVPILDKMNINAVTALAGPQSLVLAQLGAKYFFYRGIANPEHLDASKLRFGQDVSGLISTYGLMKLAELVHLQSWPRLVDLAEANSVHLPKLNQRLRLDDLEDSFQQEATMDNIIDLQDDIVTIVPQLQSLLPQDKLHHVCETLIALVLTKVNDKVGPSRREYTKFVVHEFDPTDAESRKRKNTLLCRLRHVTKTAQQNVQWLTEALGNVVSTQTTSSRTHDLKRLARQAAIQGNVAIAKDMTFDKLSAVLEEHAAAMGVLVVNVRTEPYKRYISESLYLAEADASSSSSGTEVDTCFLDSRTLYLDGLDAGIVLEASQSDHSGPLVSQHGRSQPILALPYLTKSLGREGSMLAWVCWDEFVQLRDPYTVRWMEKCNDPHIAALRIIMRSTLSEAVSSRAVTNLEPSSRETGQLMGALLMSAMSKLAQTRNTIPSVAAAAGPEDTSTLLMRGLFGNLLTIAGSGTQPMSYVWQLFGQIPNFEIPSSSVAWSWYEHATRLLPYSGWCLERYEHNAVGLLDKLVFRMMTKNEQSQKGLSGRIKRIASLGEYCRARNIQLFHSRTVVTILERMLTEQSDSDRQASAQRLLQVVPEHVENETQSYSRLYQYVHHLAKGGSQHSHYNLIAANVFTKRSAAFSEGKQRLAALLQSGEHDMQKIADACQQLLATKSAVEKRWGAKEGCAKMQNSKAVCGILDESLKALARITQDDGHDSTDAVPMRIPQELATRASSDAEINRDPWQVGGRGEFGEIEKLDRKLVHQVLGTYAAVDRGGGDHVKVEEEEVQTTRNARDLALVELPPEDDFSEFEKVFKVDFLEGVKTAASMQDVCRLLGITTGAMDAFVAMLVPDRKTQVIYCLPLTFRQMVLVLLRDRSRDAARVKPTKLLLGLLS